MFTRERYHEYIRRFNERDHTAFDDFLHPSLQVQNGPLHFSGVDGMKRHYEMIWSQFTENLEVKRFIATPENVIVEMRTTFVATRDDENGPFGVMRTGEQVHFWGIVLYSVTEERFSNIKVAYLTFEKFNIAGQRVWIRP